jgi:membrane protein DedA with SNARE-associated domain
MSFDISTFLNENAQTLSAYGYVGLFISSFVSALAIPIPAYVVLAGAGALAASGHLNIVLVLLIALAGNVLADLLGYWLASKYGKQTLVNLGFSRLMKSSGFKKFEGYLNEYPQSIIFVTRLVTEAGPVVNILSGLTGVKRRTFVFFDIIGESAYVLMFGLAGYFLGDAWRNNTGFLYKGLAMLVLLGILVGVARALMVRYGREELK